MRLSPVSLVIGLIVIVAAVIAVTTALVPRQTNPAFDVGITFVKTASQGDEAAAFAVLSPDLQAWVTANCPDGRVTGCVASYVPSEWGGFISAVYRRSQPQGADVWHVQYVGAYERDKGGSGVCIYTQVERAGQTWQVTRWSGWVWCGETGGSMAALMHPDAANHVP